MRKHLMLLRKERALSAPEFDYKIWLKEASEGKFRGKTFEQSNLRCFPFLTNNDIFDVDSCGLFMVNEEKAKREYERICDDNIYEVGFISNSAYSTLRQITEGLFSVVNTFWNTTQRNNGMHIQRHLDRAVDDILYFILKLTGIGGSNGLISALFYNTTRKVYYAAKNLGDRERYGRTHDLEIVGLGVRLACFIDVLLCSCDLGFFIPMEDPMHLESHGTESYFEIIGRMKRTISAIIDCLEINESGEIEYLRSIYESFDLSYHSRYMIDSEDELADIISYIGDTKTSFGKSPSKELLREIERILLSHTVKYCEACESLQPITTDDAFFIDTMKSLSNEDFISFCFNQIDLIGSV